MRIPPEHWAYVPLVAAFPLHVSGAYLLSKEPRGALAAVPKSMRADPDQA